MKVLHVLNELKPSGAEIMLRSAAPLWSGYGVCCDILSTGPTPGPFAPALVEAGYGVHHLRNSRTPIFLRQFATLVRSGDYDIVHQHAEGMSFWFGLMSIWAGASVLRTIHSSFSFDGWLRFRRGLQRRLLNNLGVHFVTIGDSVRNNELKRFGLESTLILNWADLTHLEPPSPAEREAARAEWGFRDEDFVVVSVGNCATVKNHGAMLHSLALNSDLGQFRYLHVGMEDTVGSERQLARKLGIEQQVIFTGWLDDPRLALYAADVYVMPSLYEGFSIAAVEALSIGLPAILTEVSGLIDFRAYFPGLIYATPDADGLAVALRTSFSIDSVQRKLIAREYRHTALKYFSPERGVAEYCAAYSSLLGR